VIEALFPPGVVTVRAEEPMAREPLHPDEAALAVGMSDARRAEFALGRACARHALARLGLRGPVLRGADRAPIWPEGVVGSLTHCDDFCAAAVAERGAVLALGLDAESDAPLRDRVAKRICTPSERAHVAGLSGPDPALWEKLLFSAKESFYKAYFTLAQTFLGFQDVEIRLDPRAERFGVQVLREDKPGPHRATGRFALASPHVITAVTLLRDEVCV
jgi:4'-phosphopantetheinyl transferase EntD